MYARLREAAKKHATKFSKIPKIPKAPKIHIPKRIHEEDAEEDEYERDPETEYNLRDSRFPSVIPYSAILSTSLVHL